MQDPPSWEQPPTRALLRAVQHGVRTLSMQLYLLETPLAATNRQPRSSHVFSMIRCAALTDQEAALALGSSLRGIQRQLLRGSKVRGNTEGGGSGIDPAN